MKQTVAPRLRQRALKGRAVSDLQLETLKVLADGKGRYLTHIRIVVSYGSKECAERGMQGLIRRGYVTWKIVDDSQDFMYTITSAGRKCLGDP